MNNEGQPLKLGRQPAFYKADVIRRFGQVKYSCQPTYESWFHTIKAEQWTAFIEEFDDEVLATVFIGDKLSNPCIDEQSAAEALDKVEQRIQNVV